MARRALSATRAADLLNYLAAHPGESLTYSELSRRLEVNLASMHSLLVALTECGYLAHHAAERTYSLGPALVALGDAALRQNPYLDTARAGNAFKVHAKAKVYRDFRKMLDEVDKQIDAVVVSTPDHTHAPAALRATSAQLP